MRILITGGFGFIGGRLAKHLYSVGHEIVIGTRNTECQSPNWLPNAEIVTINWESTLELQKNCRDIDIVVHAAGMNAQDCIDDPTRALAINGVSTSRLVSAAIHSGVNKILYLSTAHVYASPLEGIITEETCPRNLHPYATSHLAGEYAVQYAISQKQIGGSVLRLSNAFGAPVHRDTNCWMLLANDLCRQAVEKRKLLLKSSGNQARDFIPMKNVCEIIQILIERNDDCYSNTAINIGSGRSTTVLSMAELIQERCADILGFLPPIDRPVAEHLIESNYLDFRLNILNELKITHLIAYEAEIDSLLEFCNEHF